VADATWSQYPFCVWNFSWILPGRLAGMGFPSRTDGPVLIDAGISGLVSLTERAPEIEGLEVLRVPIADMTSPTVKQLDRAVQFARDTLETGGGVVVHCAAGVGRTGTVLAAYLVREGWGVAQSIEYVRALRPGSIETRGQEESVAEYARTLAGEEQQ